MLNHFGELHNNNNRAKINGQYYAICTDYKGTGKEILPRR